MSSIKPIADTPSVQQRKFLLERILASVLFRKSYKLATFLKLVCELQMEGKADEINEQRIGMEVFGRSEGYHMGDDSIVRSQARFLRIRLQEYFSTEGKDEPIILTIPKGSYVPEFRFREANREPVAMFPVEVLSDSPVAVSTPAAESGKWRSSFWRWGLIAGIGIALFLAIPAGWMLRQKNTSQVPVNVRFWTSIFDARRTTIFVPSDSSLVLLDELSGDEVQLAEYMSRKYRNVPVSPEVSKIWPLIMDSQYTNVADLNLVSRLVSLPEAQHAKTQIRFARDASLSELKQNNVVLIGSARANPWVDLFSSYGHLWVGYDAKAHINLVENRNPAPGEKDQYIEVGNESDHIAYGVVSYLPSLDGEGSALLVGGTSKAGTEAAADFLTSDQFTNFLHGLDTGGAIPHFEVLLSAENLNGNSYQDTIVCYHRLPDRH
jgi:hypothetical protein